MRGDEGAVRLGPLRVWTVRGKAFDVGERTLIPVVRIVSFGKARGTIGARQASGWGGGFTWIRPLAVLEKTARGERRISITDATVTAVRGLLTAAVTITVVLAAARRVARRVREARLHDQRD